MVLHGVQKRCVVKFRAEVSVFSTMETVLFLCSLLNEQQMTDDTVCLASGYNKGKYVCITKTVCWILFCVLNVFAGENAQLALSVL